MRNKRWLVRLAYGVLVVLLFALVVVLWTHGPGSLRRKYYDVRLGMTEKEVEAIMGPPTEDFDPATISPQPGMTPEYYASFKKWQEETARVKRWHDGMEGDILAVHFDKAGRVIHKASRNLHREKEL